MARTEIALHIEASATVEQVNAALRSVGGRIVGAVAASPQLAVAIPDPGTLAALETLLAGLRTRPGVESAGTADMPVTDELPAFATPPSVAEAGQLSHLLAMRMPAAWNARRAIDLAQRPTLLVADKFGNGPLSPQVDATYNNADLIARPGADEHGYHVVGIAASGFASNGTAAGNVTGVLGANARLHVIDAIGLTTQMTGLRIINETNARAGRVVVNTSLGAPATDAESQENGSDWAQLVRGTAGLENRMLHATSAGNDALAAANNSRWSAAAVRSDLTDAADAPMGRLRNTLAVENVSDSGAPAYEPGCLAVSSNRGGTIAAVGEDVFSHRFGALAGDKSGTSMASPEVAGLATFLWSIAPDLTGPQLRDLIVATARPPLPNDPGAAGRTSRRPRASTRIRRRSASIKPPRSRRRPRPSAWRSPTATATGRSTRRTSRRSPPPRARTRATATGRARTSTATASRAARRPHRSTSIPPAGRAGERRGSRPSRSRSRASPSSSTSAW